MPRLSPLSLEGLRRCVRPEFADMPAEDLEQIVEFFNFWGASRHRRGLAEGVGSPWAKLARKWLQPSARSSRYSAGSYHRRLGGRSGRCR